jgi:hypothetical protein
MRMLLLAAALSFVLNGCTTTSTLVPTNPVDDAIRGNLPAICRKAETAHLLFVVAASFGAVSDRTAATEKAAWEQLRPLCDDPTAETSSRVLNAAWRAYTAIVAASAG